MFKQVKLQNAHKHKATHECDQTKQLNRVRSEPSIEQLMCFFPCAA